MEVIFSSIKSKEEVECLAKLADEIWHEYFTKILTLSQIDYMVEKFQSVPAIMDQITNQGYKYYIIRNAETDIGYMGYKYEDNKLFLSKLYIKRKNRGMGYASQAFIFLEDECKKNNLVAIWLTVNRFNENTIQVYEKKGFSKVRTQVLDIGNGFVMDDYIMEKII